MQTCLSPAADTELLSGEKTSQNPSDSRNGGFDSAQGTLAAAVDIWPVTSALTTLLQCVSPSSQSAESEFEVRY